MTYNCYVQYAIEGSICVDSFSPHTDTLVSSTDHVPCRYLRQFTTWRLKSGMQEVEYLLTAMNRYNHIPAIILLTETDYVKDILYLVGGQFMYLFFVPFDSRFDSSLILGYNILYHII